MSHSLLLMFVPETQAGWSRLSFGGVVDGLRRHGLLPLALEGGCGNDAILPTLRATVEQGARERVHQEDSLIARVLEALNARGCAALLLKGAALGRWLYARPELRPASDVDLLVDPRRHLDAHAALSAAGFESDGYSQHDDASCQASYLDPVSTRQLDLHWALGVVPELVRGFEFDALLQRSQPLRGPAGARGLGRIDALMHAVVHYRAHLPVEDRLGLWLHDIALLARGLDASDWTELDRRVRAQGLAGLHAATLREAAAWFPLSLPEAWLVDWECLGRSEATRHWLDPVENSLTRLWRSLRALPNMRERMHYLRARLVPSTHWMRGRYRAQGSLGLLAAYFRRWLSGLQRVVAGR